jgi:hypothetical protein
MGSNAVQSHSGAFFDVILEWFVLVITKIGLNGRKIRPYKNSPKRTPFKVKKIVNVLSGSIKRPQPKTSPWAFGGSGLDPAENSENL